MRIAILGAAGRMGQALIQAAHHTDNIVIAGAVERTDSPLLGRDIGHIAGLDPIGLAVTDDAKTLFEKIDGVIDFTSPKATLTYAELAARRGIIHVIGTTGFSQEEEEHLISFTDRVRMVKSGNMSLGVNLLARLVELAAKALDNSFDIEILEMHHKYKVDAPSGTALLLGAAAAKGRNISLDNHSIKGRDGYIEQRKEGAIGFASLRGGGVVGDHTVIFASDGERLELTHRAGNRQTFAQGAIKAALWAKDQPPGFYTMRHVLGL